MKTYYLKPLFLLILLQLFLFISCDEEAIHPATSSFVSIQKTQDNFSPTENSVFEEIKSWYRENVENAATGQKGQRYIAWDGVVGNQLGPGDNWMFTVPLFDKEASRKVKKLMVFRNEGEIRSFEMEIAPEESHLATNGLSIGQNFSGNIKIYNNSGRLVKNTTLSEGTVDKENGLSSLDGLSTLNFSSIDIDEDPCIHRICLDEVIVVATPLPNTIWVMVPYSWQPTWNHNNTGTGHGQWNTTHLGWNIHVPTQSGPTKITKAMLQSMVDGLDGLMGAEKFRRIMEYFKQLGDAYVTGATLREVLGSNETTNKIKEIRKTGNTVVIKFENISDVIEYPINALATATLEPNNSFLFNISDPTVINIKANGIVIDTVIMGLGSVGRLRINEDGVFARKFGIWNQIIDFNAGN